ncbi:MAG TPA: hypothetical protein VHA33_13270 [Candidatus Angelobacter sp.]|nr:hypothetical protein [Candidatus Angelobacter sp.]
MRTSILFGAVLLGLGIATTSAHAGCVQHDNNDTQPGQYEDSDGDVRCAFGTLLSERTHPPRIKLGEPHDAYLGASAWVHSAAATTSAVTYVRHASKRKSTILASNLPERSR